MPEYDKKRVFIFKDVITGREHEMSEFAAITISTQGQFIQGHNVPRFRFLRSFIPVVTRTKKIKRSDGDRKQTFEKIAAYKETEILYDPPMMSRRKGLTRLPRTWLGEEPEKKHELEKIEL